MELENVPLPVPSVVWLSAMVGAADLLQQTPLADTDAPPSAVTSPPRYGTIRCDGRHGGGGHRGFEGRGGKSEIISIGRAVGIGGVSAYMVGCAGIQTRDVAGKCACSTPVGRKSFTTSSGSAPLELEGM